MSLEQLSRLVEDGEAEAAPALAGKLPENGADPLEMIEILKDNGILFKFKLVIGCAPTSQLRADKTRAVLYCCDA